MKLGAKIEKAKKALEGIDDLVMVNIEIKHHCVIEMEHYCIDNDLDFHDETDLKGDGDYYFIIRDPKNDHYKITVINHG